jgi:hypothetical protein
MPRGGKRPGAGRPPGAISKSTRAILEAVAAGGEMPLEYMLKVMRDPRESAARRDEMAKAAAPYLHPKMQATAPSIDDDSPVRSVINLTISRAPADSSLGSDKQVATRGVFGNADSSKLN